MFNKNMCGLYLIAAYQILPTFTIVTLRYVTSGYISLGLIILRYLFVCGFYISAYKVCCISIQRQLDWQIYSKQ